jgi:hypothetical protein
LAYYADHWQWPQQIIACNGSLSQWWRMGQLTEVEILDCLKTNLRLAAQSCDRLAVSPKKGPSYSGLRDQLRLVEGACRQLAFWRNGDARWLRIGMFMAEVHRRAGEWLRGIKQPDGTRMKVADGHMHPLFVKLAENLRAAYVKADELATKRTNRIGPILPQPGPAPHRETRPVGYNRSPGGIILPSGSMVQ